MPSISNFFKLFSEYPYRIRSLQTLRQFFQVLLLRISIKDYLSEMSLVPKVSQVYGLIDHADFLEHYHHPKTNFQKLWDKKPRKTKKQIEAFYQEHDLDIWRQAYLSQYNFAYKYKILKNFHIINYLLQDRDQPILDYGCGAGTLVNYLTNHGYTQVDVADIPSKTLDFVTQTMAHKLRNIITVTGKEIYIQDSYSLIVTLDVLEHTTNPLEITKRLLKALRKGGFLVISYPKEEDFSCTHLPIAQEKRPEVFKYLQENCRQIEPESIYQKQ